jgi:hypothetical protein
MPKSPESSWDTFREFAKEFKNESDRAAVILGAAQLDSYLRQLLEGYLLPVTSGNDELLEGDAPLSTFSARINLCYRLGLIDRQFAKLLHLVRRTRNSFAHDVSGVSLNTGAHRDRIVDLVRGFSDNWGFKWSMERQFGNVYTLATEFRAAIAVMSLRLHGAVDDVKVVDATSARSPYPAPKDPETETETET